MSGNWIWIVAAVGLIWFMQKARKQSLIPGDIAPSVGSVPASDDSEDEQNVQKALQAQEEVWDRIFEDTRARDEANKEVSTKLARARSILTETGLDQNIPYLWRRVADWCSYDGSIDEDDIPEGFENVLSNKTQDDQWVSWRWNGEAYRLACSDIYDNPVLDLQVADKTVLVLNCRIASSWPLTYAYTDMDAFIVGPWMAEVTKMAGLLQRTSDQIIDGFMDEMEKEKAQRIDLGDNS